MSSKPTRGPVTVCHTLVSNEVRGFSITAAPHGSCDPICASDFRSERSSSEIEANALLIKEAFDTASETGLTPQQLRAAWDEARSMLLGAECAEQSLAKENEQLREQRDELLALVKRIETNAATRVLMQHRTDMRAAIAKVEGRS